jgi:DNA-binding NarL/FixJ family response regulator
MSSRSSASAPWVAVATYRLEALTARERGVVTLLSEGMTAVAIAHRLGISPRTVHKHLENIYAKLGVRDRLSAVLSLHDLTTTPAR